MKKEIALLAFVFVAGTTAQAQGLGKISFFECQPNLSQKLSILAGADKKEVMNMMAHNGQCTLITNLNFENVSQAVSDSNGKGLLSVDQLPNGFERNHCDGEDVVCMKAEEVNRMGEADVTTLSLSPKQIQAVVKAAADGIAKKIENKSVYFIGEKEKKDVDHGNCYDGQWSSFDLRKSDLLIK